MTSRLALSVAGLAGVPVLLLQIHAGADPGAGLGPEPAPAPDHAAGVNPDVIVCRVGSDLKEYTTLGGVSGYSMGTTAQNAGDVQLSWRDTGSFADQHPVIAQNMYRLKDDRFEQIGLSWLKHGFCAADSSLCGTCQNAGTCDWLGLGCSDTYSAGLNGDSPVSLGPRSEVNPHTGEFAWPHSTPTGNNPGRLQIDINDLDPALNPGAVYYGEAQYIMPDDAGGPSANNNNSYRLVTVGTLSGGIYNLSFSGDTVEQKPALQAWAVSNPLVTIKSVLVPGDGQIMLGYLASDNGDGTWHYEYALYNMNSHRAARSFNVPVGAGTTLSNLEFHDVSYHSGEPYDGTDWSVTTGGGQVTWSTQTEAQNPNANALHWGTLYNFRFDADAAPVAVSATVELFRAGTPSAIEISTSAPGEAVVTCPWDCADGDGFVGIVDFLELLSQWNQVGSPCDVDGGGVGITDFLDMLDHWGPCP